MTLTLIEGAVDALSTYLQANIAAKVAELNSRYNDVYTLVDPVTWYLGAYPHSTPEQPSVVLLGGDWTPSMQRRDNVDGATRVDIVTFVGGNELEARFRKLCRYALGFTEMMQAGQRSMGYMVSHAGAVALSDVLDTPSFLQAVIVPITMGKTEEY